MNTYVIGDVQGCYHSLCDLLQRIDYDPQNDTLWFAGDLVNRGLHSLQTLRFIQQLPHAFTVLGNHDFHLLAQPYQPAPDPALADILQAPDCTQLLDWLSQQPLLHYDEKRHVVLTHAGLLPSWHIADAQKYAQEVESALTKESSRTLLLQNLYGNHPNQWQAHLSGTDRLRFIINALTRMRFCDSHGRLLLGYKGDIQNAPASHIPWFTQRKPAGPLQIIFGHWAALNGQTQRVDLHAVDTGCVWGNTLTALNVDTWERHTVPTNPKDRAN